MKNPDSTVSSNFIRSIIAEDLKANKNDGRVQTRFPPEPNGYLHIGHAKSICLNFGIAAEFDGICNLRFDDTNPTKEEEEYVESIKKDVRWLGFDWGDRLYYASDYFEKLYEYAVQLIKMDKAYVEGRKKLKEDEYQTSCTQACPSGAITFGDLNNPEHAVYKIVKPDNKHQGRSKNPKAFRLLERLGTNTKVYYLSDREWVRKLGDNYTKNDIASKKH